MGRDTLHVNESMGRGDQLESPDGHKKLIFQDDGHICLYLDGLFVWGTGTNGTSSQRLTMQADGNLCVYDANNSCIWQSATNHHDGENLRLQLQDDGNLCIYGNQFLWGTMTHNMRRFRKIKFRNSGRTAFDSYPLVRDAKTGNTVWNGRDNRGFYWCIRNDEEKEVDFGGDLDQDGNRLDGRLTRTTSRAVYLGLEIVAGDNVWYKQSTFVYDPNCNDQYTIQKYGGLRDGVKSSEISISGSEKGVSNSWGDIPPPWNYEKESDCVCLPW